MVYQTIKVVMNGIYPDNWHNFITNFNEIIDKYNLY